MTIVSAGNEQQKLWTKRTKSEILARETDPVTNFSRTPEYGLRIDKFKINKKQAHRVCPPYREKQEIGCRWSLSRRRFRFSKSSFRRIPEEAADDGTKIFEILWSNFAKVLWT